MKRILVRMSALATVVALGLIAIAQAQRGVEDRSQASAGPVGIEAPESGQAVQSPVVAVSGTSGPPGRLPDAQEANPLRSPPTPDRPRGTVQASGQVVQQVPTVAGPSPAAADNHPFQAPADVTLTPIPAEGIGAAEEGPLVPFAEPMSTADMTPVTDQVVGDSNYSQLPVPGQPAPLQMSPPVDRQFPPQLPHDFATPTRPDTGVPGAFSPDPGLPTSNIAGGGSFEPNRADPLAGPGQSAVSGSSGGGQGTGTPGSAGMEGAQSPQLTIQKFAPSGIQVGNSTTFRIVVNNPGSVAAHNVQVQDEIPKGTGLLNTTPPASRGVGGELVWTLGTMNPGDETAIEIELMPIEEGEIGSVATLYFSASASAKTVATKPELVMESSAPRQVLIGQEVVLKTTISNVGSGAATGVVLEERVPPGLQHPAGSELEYEVGDLAPNESRQIELRLTAERAGPATNLLIARADGNLKVEDRLDTEVLAPDLSVRMEGPNRRYLDREATYVLSVENPGTAPAKDVDLVAYLPHGLDFVSANNSGHYDGSSRSVRWRLSELPVAESGSVRLTTMPIEAGEHSLRFAGSTPSGLSAEEEHPVMVEGIAALLFEVVDVDDPIEKGGQTTYEIRVLNQGSKAATNVRVAVTLPAEMRPVAAEGPPGTGYNTEGNNVVFENLARLAPKADTTYRVRVQGLQPGDLRINVQMIADELQGWVTKQESTRVYADE